MLGLNIGSINWKNTTENLLIVIIVFLVGAGVGHYITQKTQDEILKTLKPTIEKAIDKETITNTINNAIDLKIEKIKKSDSLNININQVPNNVQKPKNIIINKKDTVSKKKSWIGRLFSK